MQRFSRTLMKILTMKKLSIVLFSVLFLAGACKKSDTPAPVPPDPAIGKWSGYYMVPNNTTQYTLNMTFTADGKLSICYKTDCTGLTASGTWKSGGGKVTGTYVNADNTSQTVYYSLTMSTDNKKLDGTFGLNTDGTGVGTMTVTKQ
jgi:hypothetical protein